MSLRTRLLVGLVGLAAVGLLIADIATYTSMRSFLDERVEEQLAAAWAPAAAAVSEARFARPRPRLRPLRPASYPAGTYAQVRGPDGSVMAEAWLGGDERAGRPDLPDDLPARTSPVQQRWELTVDARAGDGGYRVWAEPLRNGGVFFVAVPLYEMRQTLSRLTAIMFAVGVAVLLSLAALAWWVVQVGLRPLEHIARTASEIADGDLTRRVEPADDRTEVGRLGLALNVMLTQIEKAFGARTASEERLRRFLADASHELRTPLTSIRGYAELFRRGADVRPDDLARSMSRIEQEASRMGVLVEDLLVLARLDEGRPMQVEAVDLLELAADVVADAGAADPDRTIRLHADGPLRVDADAARIRQVISNLVVNALVHTDADIDVRVSAEGEDAVLAVVDHGPGVPPGQAERIFERFHRSDPSRARDTGGVGLGLAIVSAIVEAHRGSVSVEDTAGGGATFVVRLPREVS